MAKAVALHIWINPTGTDNRPAGNWELWWSFNKNFQNGYTFAVQKKKKSQNAACYLFFPFFGFFFPFFVQPLVFFKHT